MRFPEHFIKEWGKKPIDEIEFRGIIEANSRVLGLIKGDFHGVDGYMPQDQIKRLRESPNVYIAEAESMRIFYAIIHNGRKPLNDINLRLALSYAFDYDGMNVSILSNSVARNPTPLPNNIWGAPKGVAGYTYDDGAAEARLARTRQSVGLSLRERGSPRIALVDLNAPEVALFQSLNGAIRRVFEGERVGGINANACIPAPLIAPAAMGR